MVKRLFLLRHGKSSWDDPALADHDRPLAPRGRKAGKRIAAYMQDRGFEPRIVLCSTALRARQTLEHIAPALPSHSTLEIEPSLYHEGSEELLARLHRIPRETPSVLVIGHNPTVQDLALTLASEGSQLGSIRRKFPTAALAVLDARIDDWEHLGPGTTTVVDFVTPKLLRG